MTHNIPAAVEFDADYFGNHDEPGTVLCGTVRCIFVDSTGVMWCAFEMADMGGVFVISCGSRFFRRFTHD